MSNPLWIKDTKGQWVNYKSLSLLWIIGPDSKYGQYDKWELIAMTSDGRTFRLFAYQTKEEANTHAEEWVTKMMDYAKP